jgi:hypothetical protein
MRWKSEFALLSKELHHLLQAERFKVWQEIEYQKGYNARVKQTIGMA